jgi:hypothetical protein
MSIVPDIGCVTVSGISINEYIIASSPFHGDHTAKTSPYDARIIQSAVMAWPSSNTPSQLS